MTIGDRLRQLREGADMTQPQMADIVGTSKQYVGRLEKGHNQTPNGIFLEGWARYFGVNLRWLSTGEGPRDAASSRQSQLARPDPAILIQTLDFLEQAFSSLGKDFSIRTEADLFADAYAWIAEDERPVDQRNLVDFAHWRAKRDSDRSDDEQNGRLAGQAAAADKRSAAS
ncbi:hypothetical protein ARC78_14960 [Stenotrophomonas pictorum JCM 9942]|uniref:HTH cro/C1-type domain-containing protein n=1 Tax=Stenotrophomonas pictorum JCM 9942 TaxID=1236960 RepID=A0A0R0A1K4_9GAMM|nr:helix-turn-helix transcriptional regulator [Stenotrophomonas pictorum]KRG39116.1 hypothetical protein ARC78_14960 [Stenotrophomonas pictorum JCM 9942]